MACRTGDGMWKGDRGAEGRGVGQEGEDQPSQQYGGRYLPDNNES